ncbi:MAG: nitrile hydratase accessory protein [Candidatus Binatia bacterium]
MIGVARIQLDTPTPPTPTTTQRQVTNMAGNIALPRQSGELVFQAPWEGEVFALAVALCENGQYPWSEFQRHLIAQIVAADQQALPPETYPTYYEQWLAAFEALLIEKQTVTKTLIDRRGARLACAASGYSMRSFPHGGWDMADEDDE